MKGYKSNMSDNFETDLDYQKPTLAVSKTTLWMMAIAFILLVVAVVYYRYQARVDSFENRIETKKI